MSENAMPIFSDPKFLDARQNKNHCFFPMAATENISWDEIIECIDYNVSEDLYIRNLNKFAIILHDASVNSKIAKILAEYSKFEPAVPCTAHIYISLTKLSETFGWHKDFGDVVFWQAIGTTKFSVREKNQLYEYFMNPGDVIYIPRGILHNTEPQTPRVGISMGLEYGKYD
jgi:ribosomal protein L16 Arg81 hydroxylase